MVFGATGEKCQAVRRDFGEIPHFERMLRVMLADLHNHTNASDAFLTRAELLEIAEAEGVECIAVTDHDTMKNSYSLPDDPVRVIEGCELSTQTPSGLLVHVLCYLPKHRDGLEDYFSLMRRRRGDAGEIMLERVHRLYPVVTRERVMRYSSGSGVIHKQDIMNVLADFGYTDAVYGGLYRELFSRASGSCIEKFRYGDTEELLDVAKASGGVAVIAHAGESHAIELVRDFARRGLIDGAEIMHPRNSEADRRELEEICDSYKLIKTGGSDFHGRNNSRTVVPGCCYTTDEQLERLLELSDKRR